MRVFESSQAICHRCFSTGLNKNHQSAIVSRFKLFLFFSICLPGETKGVRLFHNNPSLIIISGYVPVGLNFTILLHHFKPNGRRSSAIQKP